MHALYQLATSKLLVALFRSHLPLHKSLLHRLLPNNNLVSCRRDQATDLLRCQILAGTAPGVRNLPGQNCPIFSGWHAGLGSPVLERAHACSGAGCPILGPTPLAKSQQGGKSRLYFALWLSKEGQGSCFCPG